jgi:hypothetical protein
MEVFRWLGIDVLGGRGGSGETNERRGGESVDEASVGVVVVVDDMFG